MSVETDPLLRQLVDLTCEPPDATLLSERPHAALAFLDTLGCVAAGRNEESVVAALKTTEDLDRRPLADAGCDRQALVLGIAAHALDYDDVLEPANAHASAVLVPAALSLAARAGGTVGESLDAFTTGYVVLHALGRAMNPRHYAAGWHATSSLGVIAAAATASRLLELDRTATASALALASSMASGLKCQFGYGAKHLHAGHAAAAGIDAAHLARNGLTGSPCALAGTGGFAELYGGPRPLNIHSGASSWASGTPSEQLWLKSYPSCASTHRPLAALGELIAEGVVVPGNLVDVEAAIADIARRSLSPTYPATTSQAKFSLEYCLAVLLMHGRIELEDFSEQRMCKPEVREQAGRVSVVVDGEQDAAATGVERAEVRLPHRVVRSNTYPPGHPRSPMDQSMVLDKMHHCLRYGGVTDDGRDIERLLTAVDGHDQPASSLLGPCLGWVCPSGPAAVAP